ncbi:aldo/keto reductase [Sulfurimonas sp. C5]|uniref:aldo/keto reductase family protein n=1 Tax=Sulfurimonas sp. C5 TaxID=3036947 RepID=UPI002456476B|nr:aldo/keto reductase [Sulfurimonas sp. C5]MDH4943736.1 aldo/keto reductase [Sulfurimonas sp. C5]
MTAVHMTNIKAETPKLLYGTAWKKEKTAELVEKALKLGFRGIDTACQPRHYNEASVGAALKRVASEGLERDKIFVQTKFTPVEGQDPHNIPYDKNAPLETQVFQSFEQSKINLQTNYIDSYILHSPLFPFQNLLKVWNSMEKLVHQGEVKQLGISNCYDLTTLKRLYEASEIKPAVLQNRFYKDTDYDVELRNFCNANNIQYQSFWSLSANPHLLESEPVIRAAMKHGVEAAQILYAFLISENIVPLDGTTSEQHMIDDLKVSELSLSAKELELIKQLLD